MEFKKANSDKFKENVEQAKEEMRSKMEEAKKKMQEGASKIKVKINKKDEEPAKIISIEEAKEIMKKKRDEQIQKEVEKLEKAKAKLEKKINNRLENGTKLSNQVKELVDSGVITVKDLYNPDTFKKKNFYDVLEENNASPTEDEPEVIVNDDEQVEKDLNDIHQVQFMYESPNTENTETVNSFNTNNEVYESSDPVVSGETKNNTDHKNPVLMFKTEVVERILSDLTIKGAYPDISEEDVWLDNGMIVLRVPREEENGVRTFEMFRLDIIHDCIYIQAQLDAILPDIATGARYKFISVPVESEIGIKILTVPNYIVPTHDIDINSSIFREYENAA